tara:strand:+ start:236 stop:736 length:501 start_codon:yes stop_codon:yes gene_type:complete
MKLKITKILEQHLREACNIYNFYIENSYANFEEKRISYSQFVKNCKKISSINLPYLVALYNGKVVGIAYLNIFREKSGYRFAFENTIYIDNNYHRKGIGTKLLKKLLNESKKNTNIKKIVAVIGSLDSEGSIKIHINNGFKKVGVLKKIGFKNGKWIDSIIMQKEL